MRRATHLGFSLLALGAIGIAMRLVSWQVTRPTTDEAATPTDQAQSVVDATGSVVSVKKYRRIASCSIESDALLPDLVELDRILAVTGQYQDSNPQAFRVHGKARSTSIKDLEALVVLAPDLVLVSSFGGDQSPIERLREHGMTVFDLGPMLGLNSLEKNMRDLGALVGEPARGGQMAADFRRRMRQVAAHIPAEQRRRGMVLNIYDTQLLGGTLGSSYHDVLTAAGLIDVAADFVKGQSDRRRAWPHYRVEDVLLLDPDVIVTTTGKASTLRMVPGFERLRAVSMPGGIIEIDDAILHDPGPGMLHAAEALNEVTYPRLDATTTGNDP